MTQVDWTDRGMANFQQAILSATQNSMTYAENLRRSVAERVGVLSDFPRMGRMVPPYYRPDLREVFVLGHRMIYRLSGEDVIIVGFVHGSQQITLSDLLC